MLQMQLHQVFTKEQILRNLKKFWLKESRWNRHNSKPCGEEEEELHALFSNSRTILMFPCHS